jgi:hypothetical protein
MKPANSEERELLELMEQRNALNDAIDTLELELYQCGKKSQKNFREAYAPFRHLRAMLEPAGFDIVELHRIRIPPLEMGRHILHIARKRSRLYSTRTPEIPGD